jgi:hypothetical protein
MLQWTFILVIANVAVFGLQLLGNWWEPYAFTPATAFSEPWTFVTSIFLHGGVQHVFFNMFALFIFGIFLEGLVGAKKFILIYFLAGIVGSVGYMITAIDSSIPAIGASGAVYGLIGALAALRPTAMIYMGFAPMPMIVAAIFYGVLDFVGLFSPSGIAHGSHLAGMFLGVATGLYLRFSQREKVSSSFNRPI